MSNHRTICAAEGNKEIPILGKVALLNIMMTTATGIFQITASTLFVAVVSIVLVHDLVE